MMKQVAAGLLVGTMMLAYGALPTFAANSGNSSSSGSSSSGSSGSGAKGSKGGDVNTGPAG